MSYKISNCTYKIQGTRIELTAYQPTTHVRLVSGPPKDDDRYIYVGQSPNSNYLDPESPNIAQLSANGIDVIVLKGIIDKLNNILKDNFYAEDISSPELLAEAIKRQQHTCLYDILSFGCYSRNEFNKHSKKWVFAFNQRKYHSTIGAIKYINSITSTLNECRIVINIPRSFPAYIAISKNGLDNEVTTLNQELLTELTEHPEFANNPIFYRKRKNKRDPYLPTPSLGVASPKNFKRSVIVPA